MIRFLKMILVAVPATIWYGTRIIWAARTPGPKADCLCEEIPRKWSRLLLRTAGVKVVLENAERIDPERPQVLVANHVSWFDVLALAAFLPGHYRFVAKKELANVPFFGPAWRACGHISIDREDRSSAIESLRVARRQLEEIRPTVILFPEGTRSRDGTLRAFKKGAFMLAIETGVEVIPAGISGSFDVMRKGSWMIRPGTVRVRFGEPIPVAGLTPEDRNRLTETARSAVAGLLASTN